MRYPTKRTLLGIVSTGLFCLFLPPAFTRETLLNDQRYPAIPAAVPHRFHFLKEDVIQKQQNLQGTIVQEEQPVEAEVFEHPPIAQNRLHAQALAEGVPWDVNGDRKVDIFDLVFVGGHFGEKIPEGESKPWDINDDQEVNLFDLVLVADHFGEAIPQGKPDKAGIINLQLPFFNIAADTLSFADRVVTQVETLSEEPALYVISGHGKAYSNWEMERIKGNLQDNAVLIHFDSHPDMGAAGILPRPMTREEAQNIEYYIASFISPAVLQGLVNEVYWVVPPSLNLEEWRIKIAQELQNEKDIFQQGYLKELLEITKPGMKKIYVGIITHQNDYQSTYFSPFLPEENLMVRENESVEILKTINVHTVSIEQLPDFSDEERSVIIGFDEDYYLNAPSEPFDPQRTQEIQDKIEEDVSILMEKHVEPDVISMALSPGYTPIPYMQVITETIVEELDKQGMVRIHRNAQGDPVVSVEVFPGTFDDSPAILSRTFYNLGEYDLALSTAQLAVQRYRDQAQREQQKREKQGGFIDLSQGMGDYWDVRELAIVGESLYFIGKIHYQRGELLEAKNAFQEIFDQFSYAQVVYYRTDNDGVVKRDSWNVIDRIKSEYPDMIPAVEGG